MTGYTPIYNLPYVEASDLVANYPTVSEELAENVEDAISGAGGFFLITSQAFSAQSSVSINNCFTSTYSNYRIMLEDVTIPSGSDIRLKARMRASGTDTTADYRDGRRGVAGGGTFDSNNTTGKNAWEFWSNLDFAGGPASAGVDLFTPQKTLNTAYTSITQTADASQFGTGKLLNATSYDGFTIFPGSGTFSGKVYVYAYKGA